MLSDGTSPIMKSPAQPIEIQSFSFFSFFLFLASSIITNNGGWMTTPIAIVPGEGGRRCGCSEGGRQQATLHALLNGTCAK
jgi:hypothetical protein